MYDKKDFVARKHGKEREPWVQKPMLFPPKPTKKKDDEEFERFAEMLRPVFLKMPPYAKYMKDIITNKRKMPVRTPILSHTDLACNTSYHFAASRTVFPRVPPYLAQDRLHLWDHVYDSVASIHMTENPGQHD